MLVGPHVQYCVQLHAPCNKEAVDKLERVQRRASNLEKGWQGEPHKDKLREQGIFILQKRRFKGDMIAVC